MNDEYEERYNGPDTSSGMLRELCRGTDSARWTEFATLYTPLFRLWLCGLRKAHPALTHGIDDDIIQETLIQMMKLFPEFTYDKGKGNFRAFLYEVLKNKAMKTMERYRLTSANRVYFDSERAESEGRFLADDSGNDPVAERLEILREIWEILLKRVFASGRYSRQTQAIFRLAVSGKYTLEQIGEMYGEKPNNMYQIKHRILKAVKNRREELEKGSEDLLDLLEKLSSEELGNEEQK